MQLITISNSLIKGYHHFKICPHNDVEMFTEMEKDNGFDPDAMAVRMPLEKDIQLELLDGITREVKKGDAAQTVRSFAGRMVGRVPPNLGKIFKTSLNNSDVSKVTCRSQMKPTQSKIPPAHQSYKRNAHGKDRRGGGAIIPCNYILQCRDSSYARVKEYLLTSLKELESHDGTEQVLLENEEEKVDPYSCPW